MLENSLFTKIHQNIQVKVQVIRLIVDGQNFIPMIANNSHSIWTEPEKIVKSSPKNPSTSRCSFQSVYSTGSAFAMLQIVTSMVQLPVIFWSPARTRIQFRTADEFNQERLQMRHNVGQIPNIGRAEAANGILGSHFTEEFSHLTRNDSNWRKTPNATVLALECKCTTWCEINLHYKNVWKSAVNISNALKSIPFKHPNYRATTLFCSLIHFKTPHVDEIGPCTDENSNNIKHQKYSNRHKFISHFKKSDTKYWRFSPQTATRFHEAVFWKKNFKLTVGK